MTAGQPNWQKLFEMGKLPKSARGNVPMLAQLDKAEKRIKELEAEIAKLRAGDDSDEGLKELHSEIVQVRCEEKGCIFMASGRTEAIAKNNLRLHMRSHEKKEE